MPHRHPRKASRYRSHPLPPPAPPRRFHWAEATPSKPGSILSETQRNLYDGITLDELSLAPILAARTLVETEPNYSFVTARLLLDKLRREALSFVFGRPEQATQHEMAERYADYFPAYVKAGIEAELLDRSKRRAVVRAIWGVPVISGPPRQRAHCHGPWRP